MTHGLSGESLRVIGVPSERTMTGAELKQPFVYELYRHMCEYGAQGKSVLVVGSGPNTDRWRALGCKTLDIDSSVKPDIEANANDLKSVVDPDSLEVLVSECITFDPTGKRGVDLSRFLPQALSVLGDGGRLFLVSATQISEPSRPTQTVPDPKEMMHMMKDCGFINVASWSGSVLLNRAPRVVGDKRVLGDFVAQSAVIYHGQKA